MIRKSGNRFSEKIMLKQRWRVSPAIVAPADGSFRGAGQKLAPSSYLPVEYAPLRRKVKGR